MSLLCEPNPPPADRAAARLNVDLAVNLIGGREVPADLVEKSRQLETAGPFGHARWWDSWWRNLRPRGSQLFLLTVSRGDQLVGLAPWYTQRVFGLGRVVRFLGDGRACSDYATIAATHECRDDVWRAIADWLAAEAGKSWDTFILEGISTADEPWQQLCRQLTAQNILVEQRAVANTWRLVLPETWEAYVELFSKQHRNRLRRAKRDLFDSGRAILRRATTAEDFERGFEIQRRFHQLRRHELGDAGCFADPRFEKFLREASSRFLADRLLRLQWTEVDGEPVAFDAGFVDGDGVFVYQTAFDPAKSDLSPGRLHLQASILKAIEEGYRWFDFLRGDEPYKAHFRATPIPVLETRIIGPRLVSRLGHRCWKWKKSVKARVRSMLDKKPTPQIAPPSETPAEAHS